MNNMAHNWDMIARKKERQALDHLIGPTTNTYPLPTTNKPKGLKRHTYE